MAEQLRPPIDTDALDRYWNALVSGQQPSVLPPPDVAEAIRRLSTLDPAPHAASVSARAWAETWTRMQPPARESTITSLDPGSGSARPPALRSLDPPANVRPASRVDRRVARFAALVAALLLAFLGYALLGLSDREPDEGTVIPAVIVPEATPVAPPAGDRLLTIELPAAMIHSTGHISAGLDYLELAAGSTLTHEPYCCTGPLVEYLLEGSLTVQSAAPVTVVRADGTIESIAAGQAVTLVTGDAFLAQNDAELVTTNASDATTFLLGWTLIDVEEFGTHYAGTFPVSLYADLEIGMQVAPGPARLVLTRYDTLAEIPAPGPNSYQFGLHALRNFLGTPVVASILLEPRGSPVARVGREGYYVLDFVMSPPATASPESTPLP